MRCLTRAYQFANLLFGNLHQPPGRSAQPQSWRHKGRACGLVVFFLLVCGQAWGQLTVLPSLGKYAGIVRSAEPGGWLVVKDGFMPVAATISPDNLSVAWEGDAGNYGVIFFKLVNGIVTPQIQPVVLGAKTPDPPDPPEPIANPYKPAPAYQAAAEPVRNIILSRADSHALASLYATVAAQVRAGAYQSLGAIRADLVKRGQQLNLKGKYAGLSPSVESYLTATIGREEVVPAESAGDVFETLAWAVWRDR